MKTILAIGCLIGCFPAAGNAYEYAPAPADNPLRGLVPYMGEGMGKFPHSMEFSYFSLKGLMKGWGDYDWQKLEEALEETRGRGNQLILRIYVEYPGKGNKVPDFLIKEGVGVTEWFSDGGDKNAVGTPDWEHPAMRRALVEFIAAMGGKYDGDPRIGFITAGLLGLWGEWHDYPKEELWASKEVQTEVMAAYEKAFPKTKVLLRYPSSGGDGFAPNADRPFGYHDDSFAWATLDSGKEADSWYFLPSMKRAGALEKWKTQPIGGEIRPELWEKNFTADPHPKAQNFPECVRQTHVSWLMDSGMFSGNSKPDPERMERALEETGRMGYELHVADMELVDGTHLTIRMENRGVAPFYYDWPVELEVNGKKEVITAWKISGIIPGMPSVWTCKLSEDPENIRIRIPNPMEGGKPLRFANKGSEDGWFLLME